MFIAALAIPFLGSRFYTFLATDIVILALLATSLNLLLGYTGLVSFGHAAYFAIGAYTCAILMKTYGIPFGSPSARPDPERPVRRGVRVLLRAADQIYFAMLTLAFAQIVWAICLKWNSVTGGEQGLLQRALSRSRLDGRAAAGRRHALRRPFLSGGAGPGGVVLRRTAAHRRLAVRTHPHRHPRESGARASSSASTCAAIELAAFVLAGAFAGLAGALFGLFNRGVFLDFALLVEIGGGADHDHPRRHGAFLGPGRGCCLADPAQPADHGLHAVLAVHPRLDPDRPAVRLPRRHRRRAARGLSRASRARSDA